MKTLIALWFFVALSLFGQKDIRDYNHRLGYRFYVHSKKETIIKEVVNYYSNIQKIISVSELQVFCYDKTIDYNAIRLYPYDTLLVANVLCDCFPMKENGTTVLDRLWIRIIVSKKSLEAYHYPMVAFNISFQTNKKGKTLVVLSFTGKNRNIESYQENNHPSLIGDVTCRIFELEEGLMNHLKSKFKTSLVNK